MPTFIYSDFSTPTQLSLNIFSHFLKPPDASRRDWCPLRDWSEKGIALEANLGQNQDNWVLLKPVPSNWLMPDRFLKSSACSWLPESVQTRPMSTLETGLERNLLWGLTWARIKIIECFKILSPATVRCQTDFWSPLCAQGSLRVSRRDQCSP